jgi:hypothetical protein
MVRNFSIMTPSFLTKIAKSVRRMEPDGNSFYRAIAISHYNDENLHTSIRYFAMEHLRENSESHIAKFGDSSTFWRCVNANKKSNVWNTEISDMLPTIIPEFLHIHLVIYNYDECMDAVYISKYGDESDPVVELLCTNNHYDLIEDM